MQNATKSLQIIRAQLETLSGIKRKGEGKRGWRGGSRSTLIMFSSLSVIKGKQADDLMQQ